MKCKFHRPFLCYLLVFLFLFAGCSNRETFPTITPEITSSPSPVRTASGIPTRIPTATATTTPQITATLEPINIPISNEGSELLIHSYNPDQGVFFVGEDGSILLKFPKRGDVQFSETPCNLYVFTVEWDKQNILHVGRYDIQGNLLGENTITVDPQYYYGYNLLISPDRNWVSFMNPNGDNNNAYDPRYSPVKDIFLVNIHQNGGAPQQISKNGGAPFEGAVWSPDGRYLGFSDGDDVGITQIYRWELQSKKEEQLTSFGESFRGLWIWQVQFSPDGKYLGFLGMKDKTNEPVLGIICLRDLKLTWMDLVLPNRYLGTYLFWWNRESSQVMARVEGEDPEGQYNNELIVWSDIESGRMIRTFPEKGKTGYDIGIIFPVKGLERVIFNGRMGSEAGYYLYDSASNSIKKINFPELGGGYPFYFLIPPFEVHLDQCK